MVFVGFGIAFVCKFLTQGVQALGRGAGHQALHRGRGDRRKVGPEGREVSGELAPELLGVGFLIGPRIACLMMAGAVMSYFVLGPAIATFGDKLDEPVRRRRTVRRTGPPGGRGGWRRQQKARRIPG